MQEGTYVDFHMCLQIIIAVSHDRNGNATS